MKQRFATTNWSMVLAAGEADSSRSRLALAELCEAYWYPVYAFLRRQGCTVEEARDLAQGYFLQLLEKGFLKEVRPEAGRFRVGRRRVEILDLAAGLTNVKVDLTYTDTNNGTVVTKTNDLNVPFAPVQDTSAFKTCP